MKIALIIARSLNDVIGLPDGKLPWHLPRDFKWFKEKTEGNHILMGRKTFDSLPGILPNRPHHVLTSSDIDPTGIYVHRDLRAACGAVEAQDPEGTLFIIGGGMLATEMVSKGMVDIVYLTEVDMTLKRQAGMAYFSYDFKGDPSFKQTGLSMHPKDSKNKYNFSIKTYERIGA